MNTILVVEIVVDIVVGMVVDVIVEVDDSVCDIRFIVVDVVAALG